MLTFHTPLFTPIELKNELPLTAAALETVSSLRTKTREIVQGLGDRLLVIAGPCSIHDTPAALEYADKLAKAARVFEADLLILMRVYFEKPRTNIGWKGLISDPYFNDSHHMGHGLRLARQILLAINQLGLGAATEFLDPMIPPYLSDLISWTAVGARTSGSQIHREVASGLEMSVGFKNSIDGNIRIAIDAVKTAALPHHYFGIASSGLPSIVRSVGNPDCHIILRGSDTAGNYTQEEINKALQALRETEVTARLMVDCSHGNSGKNYQRQIEVVNEMARQIRQGEQGIFGVMIESNLVAGQQNIHERPFVYGQSITDACLGWGETEPLFEELAGAVRERRGLG